MTSEWNQSTAEWNQSTVEWNCETSERNGIKKGGIGHYMNVTNDLGELKENIARAEREAYE